MERATISGLINQSIKVTGDKILSLAKECILGLMGEGMKEDGRKI